MNTNDDLDDNLNAGANVKPTTRALRLVVDHVPAIPARRRAPRRQIVIDCGWERRGGDRRQRRPGIDGLLRTVLSDNWP